MPTVACRDPDFYEYSETSPPPGGDRAQGQIRPVKRRFGARRNEKFFTMDDAVNSSVQSADQINTSTDRFPDWFPDRYRDEVPDGGNGAINGSHYQFSEFSVNLAVGFFGSSSSTGGSGDSPNYIEEYRDDLPENFKVTLRANPDQFRGTKVYFGGESAAGGGEAGTVTYEPTYGGSDVPTIKFPAYLSYSTDNSGASLGPQLGKVSLEFEMPEGSAFLPALRKLARSEENSVQYSEGRRSFQITSTNPYGIDQTLSETYNGILQNGIDDVTEAGGAALIISTGGAVAPLLIGGTTAATTLGAFYAAAETGLAFASLLDSPVESGGVSTLASAVLGAGTNVITGDPGEELPASCELNEEGVIPAPDDPSEVGNALNDAVAAKSGPFVMAGDASRRLQYTDVTVAGVSHGEAAWGRADSDSRSEFVLSGDAVRGEDFDPLSQIYSVRNGQLSALNADIVNVGFSSVAWGNASTSNGPQDLVVSGFRRGGFEPVTKLYRNRGGTFEPAGAGLVDVGQGDVEWVDYDQDGDDDLLVTGYREKSIDPASPVTQLYRNTDSGFEPVTSTGLDDVGQSEAAWADFDGDQDMDLALTGRDGDGNPVTKLYRNTGSGFEVVEDDLPNLLYPSFAWGDYDNDSDPDLAITGQNQNGQSVLSLYENEGGNLTLAMKQSPGLIKGDVAWEDFNQDGFPDLVAMGESVASGRTATFVIRNARGDQFGEARRFSGARYGTVNWGDFDGDGDPDLLQVGEQSGGTPYGRILENLQP
jgi:hypothetical protein